MRDNQPVTDEEYVISDKMTLVSKTDLQGNILSCNDAFEESSGFSRAELIGQPHNIVRHPDVPEAVFADMWQSVKAGLPWTQIVKNRRKDGGFYWVKANATPIFKNNQIVGYMSVRSKPSAAEISSATQAYEDIASGKAKITDARVTYGLDFLPLTNWFSRLNPQYQITLLVAIFYLIPFIVVEAMMDVLSPAIVVGALFGLVPPFILGLSKIKADRKKRIMLRAIASGEEIDNSWFDPRSYDGKLMATIKSASLAAQERHEETLYQLDNAARLQAAMDQISANVMIADSKLDIIYMNKHMDNFMKHRETQLKTQLPALDAHNLLGTNIDTFHQNPAHNRNMLDSIKEPTEANIQIAGYHLNLLLIPIYNRTGFKTATIVEWRDKTSEVQLVKQVGGVVDAAKSGNLQDRICLEGSDGVVKELGTKINDLLGNIEAPINATVDLANALAEGDLTHQVQGDYQGRFQELQNSLNVAVNKLGTMMAQTKIAVENVRNGSNQIYQGSIALNDRTQNQAASLEQTASSMEQMTATVKQNAHNSQEATKVTQNSASLAHNGVTVMKNAIKAMEKISESSAKINDIIGLIDSIAFQTNLLALNAAVEAARAGEHGRGFAVVAGEVRTLAQKSSDAAKDIRNLIEDTVQQVSEGSEHVKGSGKSLNEIVDSITKVNQIIEEIASSSKEQSAGVTQVNSAITNIDNAVQQNAAMVEETAATAEELGHMSKTMADNVNQFKISKQATANANAMTFSESSTAIPASAPKVANHNKPQSTIKAEPPTPNKVEQPNSKIVHAVDNEEEWDDF